MADTRDPERDQPAPMPGKVNIPQYLIQAIAEREHYGITKYGRPLQSHNGRNPMIDLWEELMDALNYTTQVLVEQGVPLPGATIPEGHPAYNLVQDLIEGDAKAQDTAAARLGKPVPKCITCNQVSGRSHVEAAADLERLNWIFTWMRRVAVEHQVESDGGAMTDAEAIWPTQILDILDGKLAPGIEV